MYKKILLATDGSQHAILAAKQALAIAKDMGAEVTILNVAPIPVITLLNYYPSMIEPDILPQQVEERLEDQAKKILEDAKKIFEESGVKAGTQLEFGHPADTICQVAKDGNFDLLVMGSRGYGDIQSLLLGSISHKVIQCVHIPVLVVK